MVPTIADSLFGLLPLESRLAFDAIPIAAKVTLDFVESLSGMVSV